MSSPTRHRRGRDGTDPSPGGDPDAAGPTDLPVPSYVPTGVVFGPGAATGLAAVVRERLGPAALPRRPLVLTGRAGPGKPWLDQVVDQCRRLGAAVLVENSRPNPTGESIQAVLEIARRAGADGVVAVGGGSVLDTGKTVALLLSGTASVAHALRHGVPESRRVPLVAVPTTAGSGAEVTRTATVWDDRAGRKHALDHPQLFPDLAVVDPLLSMSAPTSVWASAGLDALSQAVESSWAVAADAESLRFSLPAVRLAADGLRAVLAAPDDVAARTRLSRASLTAGLAIARTRTTIPHALSYPMTARWGLAHGHACALTLGAVLRFNAGVTTRDCHDPRGAQHTLAVVRAVGRNLGAPTPAAAARQVATLVRRLGLPALHQLDHLDPTEVVDDVLSYDRFRNNPRHMSRARLTALLTELATPPAECPQ